jgi:hypothetical protein
VVFLSLFIQTPGQKLKVEKITFTSVYLVARQTYFRSRNSSVGMIVTRVQKAGFGVLGQIHLYLYLCLFLPNLAAQFKNRAVVVKENGGRSDTEICHWSNS